MAMTDPDTARPRVVTGAVLLAYLTGVLLLVVVVSVLVNADDNADRFVRDHPDVSRSVALTGSYIVAGVAALFSVLTLASARALGRGRRWGWVFLLVLSGVGLVGVVSVRSLLDALRVLPDAALLACLLAPSARAFVSEQTYLAKRPDTSVPWYADN